MNMTPFKSKLKVKYSSSLGMWIITGESLTRTDCNGLTFYDKVVVTTFKDRVDDQDFHFYHENIV